MLKKLLFLALLPFLIHAEEYPPVPLLRDLMIAEEVERCDRLEFPRYDNFLLHSGYWMMPSARMKQVGMIGYGFSSVPPYRFYNISVQPFSHLELSGNYRVFRGVEDPVLSKYGYGDMTDKGMNAKLALLLPEDSAFTLPGIAIGAEDFLGTKGFESQYVVFTQIIQKWNLEMSLGYGGKRIGGLFGGATWTPWDSIAFSLEYDATRYTSSEYEPHPDGRARNCHWNFGGKLRICDFLDGSLAYMRGRELAFSFSMNYNLGLCEGALPKIKTPLPYSPSLNCEVVPIEKPFFCHGFTLLEAAVSVNCCDEKTLRLLLRNDIWRCEQDIRRQLNALLPAVVPEDIDWVIVELDGEGVVVQEFRYSMKFLEKFAQHKMSPYELTLLSPQISPKKRRRKETCIYYDDRGLFHLFAKPKSVLFFGSSSGKIKGAAGVQIGSYGYLFNQWYYSLIFGKFISSNLSGVKDFDRLNPSQLLNVRTDSANYFKQEAITVDEAYLERSWNLGGGLFSRFAIGYFEEQYGGIASEILYAPIEKNVAIGIEWSTLRKRRLNGIGFTDRYRRFEGKKPVKVLRYGVEQFFINGWWWFPDACIELHLKAGKFLADDWGLRTEVAREYPSGMRLFAWYTVTDGKDTVNGRRYYDKGVGIALPLDLFYTSTSRRQWSYSISAWLRDIGAIAETGRPLYPRVKSYWQ